MDQKVKCSLHGFISFVIALLLLSVAVQGQDQSLVLRNLFKEALVNSSDNIFQLQQVYFNPSSVYSPTSVCLKVTVIVDNIQNILEPDKCYISFENMNYTIPVSEPPAFQRCNSFFPNRCTSGWYFASSYILNLADYDDDGDTSQLSDSLTNSGSSGVFYAFDPTFYNIIKALSVSIALSFPLRTEPDISSVDSADIEIHISEDFPNMPCWSEVDIELRMVLVWVSIYL